MISNLNFNLKKLTSCRYKSIFIIIYCFLFFPANSFCQENRQVKRTVVGNGTSIIRENIEQNKEFNFFRDWSKVALLKSGIGETVELFPIVFSIPDKKIELYGLQLDVEVKPQKAGIEIENSGSIFNLVNKNIYKKKSIEYVFKSNELFFSFFIYEKKARITMHIIDYGPSGVTKDGDQIEFWTESKVDDIPEFLQTLKELYSTMK